MCKSTVLATALSMAMAVPAAADQLSLAYFMGPNHSMNGAFFTPMGEMIEAESGGSLTVKQFPGGALNQSPPAQYSLLLDGAADLAFLLPSFTNMLFPRTSHRTFGACAYA